MNDKSREYIMGILSKSGYNFRTKENYYQDEMTIQFTDWSKEWVCIVKLEKADLYTIEVKFLKDTKYTYVWYASDTEEADIVNDIKRFVEYIIKKPHLTYAAYKPDEYCANERAVKNYYRRVLRAYKAQCKFIEKADKQIVRYYAKYIIPFFKSSRLVSHTDYNYNSYILQAPFNENREFSKVSGFITILNYDEPNEELNKAVQGYEELILKLNTKAKDKQYDWRAEDVIIPNMIYLYTK